MQTEQLEKRRFKRVFFSETDDVIGMFRLSEHHGKIMKADISDLCEVGLCLILKSYAEDAVIHEGDHLILTEVKGKKDFSFLTDIAMEVKWTLTLKHLAIGCEFFDTSQRFIDHIRAFIDSQEKHQ